MANQMPESVVPKDESFNYYFLMSNMRRYKSQNPLNQLNKKKLHKHPVG